MKIPRKITFRSVKTPFEQNILAMGLTRLLSLPGVPKTLLPFNVVTSLSFWLSKKHTENCRGTDKAVSFLYRLKFLEGHFPSWYSNTSYSLRSVSLDFTRKPLSTEMQLLVHTTLVTSHVKRMDQCTTDPS